MDFNIKFSQGIRPKVVSVRIESKPKDPKKDGYLQCRQGTVMARDPKMA